MIKYKGFYLLFLLNFLYKIHFYIVLLIIFLLGPFLQGVKVVIAQSFERIHRSNLVGMGILPLEFKNGESAESLGLTGKEELTILLHSGNFKINQDLEVKINGGKTFVTKVRLDTDPEIAYFKNGGILNYVIRKIATQK